jgi:hypothetical protein
MRTANNYTTESLERSLDVHVAHGVIKEWMPPEAGQPRWQILLSGNLNFFEWTAPQVYAFCVGAAEAYRRGQEAS